MIDKDYGFVPTEEYRHYLPDGSYTEPKLAIICQSYIREYNGFVYKLASMAKKYGWVPLIPLVGKEAVITNDIRYFRPKNEVEIMRNTLDWIDVRSTFENVLAADATYTVSFDISKKDQEDYPVKKQLLADYYTTQLSRMLENVDKTLYHFGCVYTEDDIKNFPEVTIQPDESKTTVE